MPEKTKEKLEIQYFGCSDIGLVRIENQDSFGKFPQNDFDLYSEKGQLFIVADGMGGHVGGKEASSTAVESIRNVYFDSVSENKVEVLKKAFEKANSDIYNKSTTSDQFKRMGTTCSLLLIKDEKGYIAHVGDSRIYKIENSKIEQLTDDHTKVLEMLKNGLLTPKEAENYPSKSVLARAMGVEQTVNADFKDDVEIKKGQSYILCSDGLGKVSKEEILQIVPSLSPKEACDKLISLANERGGKDNVTVLIIKIGSKKIQQTEKIRRKRKFPFLKVLLLAAAIILIALGVQHWERIIETYNYIKSGKTQDSIPVIPQKKVQDGQNDSDTNYGLLIRADKFYKSGKLESALELYKKILYNEPMHLGALQGVNNIAAAYINRAEEMRRKNNFSGALKLLQKVSELQPSNKRVQQMIEDCNIQMNNSAADTNSLNNK